MVEVGSDVEAPNSFKCVMEKLVTEVRWSRLAQESGVLGVPSPSADEFQRPMRGRHI